MNATTLLLRKLHRIGELLAALEHDPRRRVGVMTDVIDEVMSYVALEDRTFLPVAEQALGTTVRSLRTTHVRARLALFRMATSETDSVVFARTACSLREAFREHALVLAGVLQSLERILPAESITSLANEMRAKTLTSLEGVIDDAPPRFVEATPRPVAKRAVSGVVEKIVAA